MKVTCHQCGKKYRVDVTKILGAERSFKCRGCQTIITVFRPETAAEAVGQDFFTNELTPVTISAPTPVAKRDESSFADLNDWSGSAGGTPVAAPADDFLDSLPGDATADFVLSDMSDPFEQPAADAFSDDLLADVSSAPEAAEVDSAPAREADESGEEKPGLMTRFAVFWQRLTGKMILAMLAAGLMPLLLFAGISYYFTYQGLNSSAQQLMQQTATGLGTQVEEWVDKNLKVLQAIATMPGMVSMDPAEQESLLKSVAGAYPWVDLVFTLDGDGINIARSDERQPISYAHRQYYWDIVDGKQFAWQTLIEASTGEPALIIAVPIREEGALVGVVAASMRIGDIAQWVATWKAGETGYAALIEKNGKIIVHPDKTLYEVQYNLGGAEHPLALAFRKGETGGQRYTREDGTEMFGYLVGTQHGWGLMVEQEVAEAFELTEQMKPLFAMVLLGALLLSVLFGVVVSRQITRPVLRLSDAADRLSLGELDLVIDISSKDEIGELAKSITRMQDSLRIALEWLRSMK